MIPRYPFQLKEVTYLANHPNFSLKTRHTMNFENRRHEDVDGRVRGEEIATNLSVMRGKRK